MPKKTRVRPDRIPRLISRYTGLPLLMNTYHSIVEDEDIEKYLPDGPDGPELDRI